MLALFEGWSPVYTPLLLTMQLPRERVWPTLRLCFYDAGLLSEAASSALEAAVNAALDRHGIGETLPWRVGMGLLTASRPA